MDRDEALATIDAARAAGEHIADDVYKIAYAPEAPAQPEAAAPATTTAPSALTPDAARAQIPAILDQLYKATPGSPEYVALDQRRNDLYRAAYAEKASSPPAVNEFTSLTPSERTARIGAIRDLMGQYNVGSFEHQCLQDDLDACSQAAETSPAVSRLDVEPISADVTDDAGEPYRYDETATAEVGALADKWEPALGMSPGELRREFRMWSEVAAARLKDKIRMAGADVDKLLEQRSGSVDRWPDEAKTLMGLLLTPRSRVSFEHWLNETGMTDHPAFIERLADLAAKLRAGGK
jgi:hypothetical protein